MRKYKNLGKGGPGNMPSPLPAQQDQQVPSMPSMPAMPDMSSMQQVQPNQATGQPISEDAKARLKSMIEELKTKQGQINAMKFSDGNKVDNERQKALMEVFSEMQKSGIDPSNIQQVKEFLDKLQAQNPELYKVFVSAFETLIGQQGGEGQTIPITGGALSSMVGGNESQPIQTQNGSSPMDLYKGLGQGI